MIDYFALLGIERRPAITEETLKGAYFQKSESLHLDPARSSEVFAVNAAFQTIANPATRIQHLLTLEFGDASGGEIAPDLGKLFGIIVEVLQIADQELGSLSARSSPILRALAYQSLDGLREKLEQAEEELSQLLQRQGRPHGALRVAVIGGGCSGLQYKMDLVDGPANRDILVESNNVRVVVDPKSALFVSGSLLDYSEDLQKGGFKVTNPNAVAHCSCGESFSA